MQTHSELRSALHSRAAALHHIVGLLRGDQIPVIADGVAQRGVSCCKINDLSLIHIYVNATKKLIIEVDGKTYARHAIQIPFVNVGDDYDALVRQYVVPLWQSGDIVSVSEKIVALCQKRVVYAQDVQPGLLARILCRFVAQTKAGPGAGVPYKMQFAINQCGAPKILWACLLYTSGKSA